MSRIVLQAWVYFVSGKFTKMIHIQRDTLVILFNSNRNTKTVLINPIETPITDYGTEYSKKYIFWDASVQMIYIQQSDFITLLLFKDPTERSCRWLWEIQLQCWRKMPPLFSFFDRKHYSKYGPGKMIMDLVKQLIFLEYKCTCKKQKAGGGGGGGV